MDKDLETMLEEVSVHGPGQWENAVGPKDWYAVSTEDSGGIIAYFSNASHAYAFRLFLINASLNPLV